MDTALPPMPRQEKGIPIEIDGRDTIFSVIFLPDGKHFISGGAEQIVRRWKVDDGTEVGPPMNSGHDVYDLAASLDSKWIVVGMDGYRVGVWNAMNYERVAEYWLHGEGIFAVDISPDGTRMVTGAGDWYAYVSSLSTGKQLIRWQHEYYGVAATKYSPDGCLVATATWWRDSVRIHDSQDGHLFVTFPIQVSSRLNQSLAWAHDSKRLFVLSYDGHIHCVDVVTGTAISRWSIYDGDVDRGCIALARNGSFVACSALSSVLFWDVATLQKIGPVLEHADAVWSMDISTDYNIVTGAGKTITLWNLRDLLPPNYLDNVSKPALATDILLTKDYINPMIE